jgi:hypothetical protein
MTIEGSRSSDASITIQQSDATKEVTRTEAKEDSGKTMVSYDVKLQGRSFKVTVGFDKTQLEAHFKGETDKLPEGQKDVLTVVDKIVNGMKAEDLIAMSGTKISTSISDTMDTQHTQVHLKGEPNPTALSELSGKGKGELAKSITSVIQTFSKSEVSKLIQSSMERPPPLTPQPQPRVDSPSNPVSTEDSEPESQEAKVGDGTQVRFTEVSDENEATGTEEKTSSHAWLKPEERSPESARKGDPLIGARPQAQTRVEESPSDPVRTETSGSVSEETAEVSDEKETKATQENQEGSKPTPKALPKRPPKLPPDPAQTKLAEAKARHDALGPPPKLNIPGKETANPERTDASKNDQWIRAEKNPTRREGGPILGTHPQAETQEGKTSEPLPKGSPPPKDNPPPLPKNNQGPPPPKDNPPPLPSTTAPSENMTKEPISGKTTEQGTSPVGEQPEGPTVEGKQPNPPIFHISVIENTEISQPPQQQGSSSPISMQSQKPEDSKNQAAQLRANNQPLPRFDDRSADRKVFAGRADQFDAKYGTASTKEEITESSQLSSQIEFRSNLVKKYIKAANGGSHVVSHLARVVRHFDDIQGAKGRVAITSDGTNPTSVAKAVTLKRSLYNQAIAERQNAADAMIEKLKPPKDIQKMRSELINPDSKIFTKNKANIEDIRRALAFELAKALIDPAKYGADAQKMLDNLNLNPDLRDGVIKSNVSLKFLLDKFQNELQNQQGKIRGAIGEYHSYANRLKGLQDDIARQTNGPSPKQQEQLEIYQVQVDFFKEQLAPILRDAQAMLNFGKGTEEHSQLQLYVDDLAHIVSSDDPAQAAAKWKDRDRTVQDLMAGMQTSYQTGMGGDSGIPFLNELNPETVLNGHAALIIRDPANKEKYEKLSELVQSLVDTAQEHAAVLKKGYSKDSVRPEYKKGGDGTVPEDIQAAVKELRQIAQSVKQESETMQFASTGNEQAGTMSSAQLAIKAGQFLRFLEPFNVE